MKNGLVVDSDGNKFWYVNDKFHRIDGPAIISSDGTQTWCINGKLHREDGPAIIRANGKQEWWINGNRISDKDIIKWQEQYNIPINHEYWNKEHKMLFKLRFFY